MEKCNVGVIGCGVISEIYLANLTRRFSSLRVVSCADYLPERSRERAQQFDIEAQTVEELLGNPHIDVVLNLTTPQSHGEISLAALRHGKHVYSEKTLATSLEDAQAILDEAARRGLRVGCAPDTFLGAGLQTAFKSLADGWIGRPLSGVAFVTCRGHERWHTSPAFYYQRGGGPHMDMGPYYITALVAALGRVKRVSAMSSRAFDSRVIGTGPSRGEPISVEVDTHYGATLEFDCGVVATVILSFDIWSTHLPFLELYGTDGTLTLPNPNFFDGPVLYRSMHEEEFRPLPLLFPYTDNVRGLGLAQMCREIRRGGQHCASGAMGLHVLDVLLAVEQAAESGGTVACKTPFTPPPRLPWGRTEMEYGF